MRAILAAPSGVEALGVVADAVETDSAHERAVEAFLVDGLPAILTPDAAHALRGIRHLQEIFRAHADRLYHWVTDRAVPPDNNRAERELRPTVIARKVSFGSQSAAGAKTREILMSVLHTLKKRRADAPAHFKWVLHQLAAEPQRDPFALLFSSDTS